MKPVRLAADVMTGDEEANKHITDKTLPLIGSGKKYNAHSNNTTTTFRIVLSPSPQPIPNKPYASHASTLPL